MDSMNLMLLMGSNDIFKTWAIKLNRRVPKEELKMDKKYLKNVYYLK